MYYIILYCIMLLFISYYIIYVIILCYIVFYMLLLLNSILTKIKIKVQNIWSFNYIMNFSQRSIFLFLDRHISFVKKDKFMIWMPYVNSHKFTCLCFSDILLQYVFSYLTHNFKL